VCSHCRNTRGRTNLYDEATREKRGKREKKEEKEKQLLGLKVSRMYMHPEKID
jgi:hypothetical protein